MNELIHIEDSGEIQTVNARDLWEKLEAKKDFTDWIKYRIEKYGFIENKDFTTILGKTSKVGGRPSTEYHLSLDMAKELAMVENNEKGREIRRYFIRIEKKFRKWLTSRNRSKTIRRDFTDTLKEFGYSSPNEYSKTTTEMKLALNIGSKSKDSMTRLELAKVMASECLATVGIIQRNERGFGAVHPVCVRSSMIVENEARMVESEARREMFAHQNNIQ